MFPGSHPDRHHFLHKIRWELVFGNGDPPGGIAGIDGGYSACDLIADDGFDTVGADKNISLGARTVIEEQFDMVG